MTRIGRLFPGNHSSAERQKQNFQFILRDIAPPTLANESNI